MFIRKGEWAPAEQAAIESLSYAQRFNTPGAIWPFAIALFVIRKDQGRLGDIEPWLKTFREQFPGVHLIDAAVALALVDMGRLEEAGGIALPIASNTDSIVRDQFRPVTMGMLAEVCSAVGDVATASGLYDALLPWHDRQFMVAAGAVYGSAARPLGLLATVLERYDDAEAHFEEALAMNRKMQAPPWVARTQHDYARMLLRRDAPGDRERARELLDAALATAREIDMTKLQADCEALLATA
jgi:tetratricopeptide (TPR) repeat protein